MAGSEWGSPPRMRGKVLWAKLYWSMIGITPAYAGKSSETFRNAVNSAGSPPRMRGKEKNAPFDFTYTGITPACAGKSYTRLA